MLFHLENQLGHRAVSQKKYLTEAPPLPPLVDSSPQSGLPPINFYLQYYFHGLEAISQLQI